MNEKAPNPYVGPVPFTINDSNRFYGRSGDLRRLMVLFVAQRIVLLYSPSGAGKTSLVQAKMIPALERKGFEVLPVIRVSRRSVDGTPAINTFVYSTINSLMDEDQQDNPGENVEVSPSPKNIAMAYSDLVHFWQGQRETLGDKRVVLFFDQFEEVLTADAHDQGQKEQFFDELGAILEGDDRLWALFAIREDYLAELDPFRHLIPGELSSTYRLELLNEGQALAAIQKPAADVGVTFEDDAAGKLVNELRRVQIRRRDGQITFEEGPFVEPVQLQVVCQTLWGDLEPEVGDTIGADSVSAEGHVDESLGEFYDKTVAQIAAKNGVDQRDIRDWFDRQLITEQGLRGQVMGSVDLGLSQEVVDDLVTAHLIRAEERRGIQWYELAHDRLVKPVRQHNEAWYESNLSLLQVRAEAWNKSGDEALLLRGRELKEGQAWAEDKQLKEYEQSFLETSRDRERGKRVRRIAAIVGLVFIIGVSMGMFLLWQRAVTAQSEAQESAKIAQTREAEAESARTASDHNANLAATSEANALAEAEKRAIAQAQAETEATRADENAAEAQMQATVVANQKAEAEAQALKAQTQALISLSTSLLPVNRNPFPDEVEQSLLMSVHALTTSQQLEKPISTKLLDEQARRLLVYIQARPNQELLHGHEDWVWSVAFSPDGTQLASGSDDQTIRLWDLSVPGAEPLVLRGHEDEIRSVAFSPDGTQLASGSSDQTIRLWNLSDPGTEPLVLSGHEDWVRSVAFSPDGTQLASGSSDQTIRLWNLSNPGTEPLILRGHEDWVWSVAFSPDGSRLASGSSDQTIRLWNLSNPGTEPQILRGHKTPVNYIAFSPDGSQLASGSDDRTVLLWDLSNPGAEPLVLRGHLDWVRSVAFSPDGSRLASGSSDQTIRLWDLADLGGEPLVLRGHDDWAWSVAFSPDGEQLASGSVDRTIRLWIPTNPEVEIVLRGHAAPVRSVAFSPGGNRLASGSDDQTIRLWDLTDPEAAPLVLDRHNAQVWSVAFSPDGGRLASGSEDRTIRLWDLTDPGAEPLVLDGHEAQVRSVAFSPDGGQLASGSSDQTIRLWDLTNPGVEPLVLTGHEAPVWSIAFSPDGERLASGSEDQTIHLWDLRDPEAEPLVLTGHEDWVWSIAFSPDGERLASGSEDQTIRLWNLSDPGAEPLVLIGHEAPVSSVAFSPDGEHLASGSEDQNVRLWRSTLEGLMELACDQAGRNFTWEEWQEFLPGRDYEKTCPQYPVHCSVTAEEWPEEFIDEQSLCSGD